MARLQPGLSSTVSVVHPEQFSTETAQTSDSVRMSAISTMQGIASSLWAGTFLVEPLGKTGIHHHGDQDTVVYVLEGEGLVRWGQWGECSAVVKTGDFLHVPRWLPHQELNPSSQRAFRWVVVRSSPEPIVNNLPEHFWQQGQTLLAERQSSTEPERDVKFDRGDEVYEPTQVQDKEETFHD